MKSKGMQLGAMFAAMLLVSMAFLGAAASNKRISERFARTCITGII